MGPGGLGRGGFNQSELYRTAVSRRCRLGGRKRVRSDTDTRADQRSYSLSSGTVVAARRWRARRPRSPRSTRPASTAACRSRSSSSASFRSAHLRPRLAHVLQDRPLGPRRDDRFGQALDPHPGAPAVTPLGATQRLEGIDLSARANLPKPRNTIHVSVAITAVSRPLKVATSTPHSPGLDASDASRRGELSE